MQLVSYFDLVLIFVVSVLYLVDGAFDLLVLASKIPPSSVLSLSRAQLVISISNVDRIRKLPKRVLRDPRFHSMLPVLMRHVQVVMPLLDQMLPHMDDILELSSGMEPQEIEELIPLLPNILPYSEDLLPMVVKLTSEQRKKILTAAMINTLQPYMQQVVDTLPSLDSAAINAIVEHHALMSKHIAAVAPFLKHLQSKPLLGPHVPVLIENLDLLAPKLPLLEPYISNIAELLQNIPPEQLGAVLKNDPEIFDALCTKIEMVGDILDDIAPYSAALFPYMKGLLKHSEQLLIHWPSLRPYRAELVRNCDHLMREQDLDIMVPKLPYLVPHLDTLIPQIDNTSVYAVDLMKRLGPSLPYTHHFLASKSAVSMLPSLGKTMQFLMPDKSHWEADDARDSCALCKEKWSVKTRRHHCRKCGRLVCSNCSLVLDERECLDCSELKKVGPAE